MGSRVWLAVEHQAVTDAGADGQVNEIAVRQSGAVARLCDRRGARVRFETGWGDFRERRMRAHLAPFDQVVTTDLALEVYQFADAYSDAADLYRDAGSVRPQPAGHSERVAQHGLATAFRKRRDDFLRDDPRARQFDQAGGDFRAAEVYSDGVAAHAAPQLAGRLWIRCASACLESPARSGGKVKRLRISCVRPVRPARCAASMISSTW